jgi:hypothetical protein
MKVGTCAFCAIRGAVAPCECAYRETLECGEKPTCADCQRSHKTFGVFFKALAATNPATRSNSPRTKLLGILRDTLCYHGRREIPQLKFCFDRLDGTNSFDPDAANFRHCILDIAGALPLNAAIAATIKRKLSEAVVAQSIERIDDAWRQICAKEEQNKQIGRALETFQRVVRITSR